MRKSNKNIIFIDHGISGVNLAWSIFIDPGITKKIKISKNWTVIILKLTCDYC